MSKASALLLLTYVVKGTSFVVALVVDVKPKPP